MLHPVGDRTKIDGPVERRNDWRSAPPQVRSIQLGIDVPLLLIIATLLIIGLVMVYSASYNISNLVYDNPNRIFTRQVIWMVLGLCICIGMIWLDYHYWRRWALWAMVGTIVALMGVLFLNNIVNGAVRTLWGGSIQPSEAAKLMIIIYLSVWLFAKKDQITDVNFGLIPMAAMLGALGGLIFLQPDISAVITIMVLGGIMFFLAGGDLRQILILVLVALVVGAIIVRINPTGLERVNEYFDGLKDPTKASYHVRRAIESFVRGGWIGVGIGNGKTKLTGLPVPQTDSIFAVIGEETGALGAVSVISLYGLLLWRGLTISRRAPDMMGKLLAAGLSIWICMEAFVNMAVMLNLLPFAGNALPFISSGGSSLVVTLAGIGILLNISRRGVQEEDARVYGAVVDLRRRDGRRRVSSPRRSSDHAE